jgi:hypothetical protein
MTFRLFLLPILVSALPLAAQPGGAIPSAKTAAAEEASVDFHGTPVRYFYTPAPTPAAAPLVVALPGGATTLDTARELLAGWQRIAGPRGWRIVVPLLYAGSDPGVKALDILVADARKRLHADPSRTYLAGAGLAAGEVFLALSRTPDLWAAALAIQGNPAGAINTNHLYGSNTTLAPLLWIDAPPFTKRSVERLTQAGYHFEIRKQAADAEVLDWLASHSRDAFPAEIDCETGNPAFGRCYWIEMTRFDPARRNTALGSSRVRAGSGASLGFGPFGYDPAGTGPGIAVSWLPPDAKGPLLLNDRILAVAGREIRDAADYSAYMDEEVKEEKSVAVLVERGKERLRLETRTVLPKREELISARVRGSYSAEQKEILIISRTVSEMKVTVPPEWAPAQLSWNGTDFKVESAGCWILSAVKEPPTLARCP